MSLSNETKSTLDNLASAIDEKIHKAIDEREIQAKKSSFGISEKKSLFQVIQKGLRENKGNKQPFEIKAGDRIAQLVIAPVERIQWQAVGSLDSSTKRGENGFGSTGK